jgi:hypothetical protein
MIENRYASWLEALFQTGEKPYLQNQQALDYLKREQALYNAGIAGAGTAMLVGGTVAPPIGIVGGAIALTAMEISRPVDRLVSVVEELLKIDGIIVTPRVKTDEGTIDLLVKMPDRRGFAFTLRSKQDSRVKWREEEQNFFAITPRKGKTARVKRWSELIKSGQDLNKMTLALKKQKSYLLGESRTERHYPITKAIILTSTTKIDPNNNPDLFVDFGETKALRVHAGSYMYVLEQRDVIKFLAPVPKTQI